MRSCVTLNTNLWLHRVLAVAVLFAHIACCSFYWRVTTFVECWKSVDIIHCKFLDWSVQRRNPCAEILSIIYEIENY